MLRIKPILVIAAFVAAGGRESGAQTWRYVRAPPLRILFVGNSLTAGNDLPRMVQALARAGGDELVAAAVTIGGASLEDQWHQGAALRAIRGERWDLVVLQQGPSSLPESRDNLREWTRRFAPEIRGAGGRAALLMVWPDITRLEFFDDVRDSYSLAAADVKGAFFPAGEVWRAAWRRDPSAPLYAGDNFHPSAAGSYAAALSIYGLLYQRAPRDLPATLELEGGQVVAIPEALAALLQEAAVEANARYGRP